MDLPARHHGSLGRNHHSSCKY